MEEQNFVAGILRQKQIALLLWQDEEKKKDEGTTSSVGAGEKGPTRRKWGGFFFVCLVKVIKSLTRTLTKDPAYDITRRGEQ